MVDRQPEDFAVTGTGFSVAGTCLRKQETTDFVTEDFADAKSDFAAAGTETAREKENQIESAAHQARCPGDRRRIQQKTRESREKTEEVKPKQHASWKWKPRQKWEQD